MDPPPTVEQQQPTTFLALPTVLQLNIIKQLPWSEQKTFRLVCHHTLGLVKYVDARGITLCVENDDGFRNQICSIQKLITCPFPSIYAIKISRLTTPLPIISSSRLGGMPKTNWLIIGSFLISLDNIFKLTRYYMKWCKKLCFRNTNLPFIKNCGLFGNPGTGCVNVRIFIIMFFPKKVNNNLLESVESRLHSFGQFLAWACMPSLTTLGVYIKLRKNNNVNNEATTTHQITSFCKNFENFLIKHGPRLEKCIFDGLPGIIWKYILPTFEFMSKTSKLRLYNSSELKSIEPTLVAKGFSHFTNLTSLVLDSKNQDVEFIGFLLPNNKSTLVSLKLLYTFTSLSWLYKISYGFSHLTYLKLYIQYDSTILNEVGDFKLDSVRKLKLCLESHNHNIQNGEDGQESLDWRHPLMNWLIHITPNLITLKLTTLWSDDAIHLQSYHILLLINGLSRLTCISFKTYRLSVGRPIPCPYFTIDNELRQWLEGNEQIQLLDKFHLGCCLAYIDRPNVVQQQQRQADEEET